MKIVILLRTALTALRINMLRSFLTMLGIIIGVAAVIIMVAMGAGAFHGRIYFNNRDSMAEATGHGAPLPHMVHGGPGRARHARPPARAPVRAGPARSRANRRLR